MNSWRAALVFLIPAVSTVVPFASSASVSPSADVKGQAASPSVTDPVMDSDYVRVPFPEATQQYIQRTFPFYADYLFHPTRNGCGFTLISEKDMTIDSVQRKIPVAYEGNMNLGEVVLTLKATVPAGEDYEGQETIRIVDIPGNKYSSKNIVGGQETDSDKETAASPDEVASWFNYAQGVRKVCLTLKRHERRGIGLK